MSGYAIKYNHMTDLIKTYNPANASTLTPEQMEALQKLTSAELKELATAYPNLTMQRAYLLIADSTKAVHKQLPTLSSYENLWNLREKNGQRQYVAVGFKGTYKVNNTPTTNKREILDLSEKELLSLPGFKIPGIQLLPKNEQIDQPKTVTVTKVRKVNKTKSK